MVKPHQRPSNKNNDNKSEKEKNDKKKKAKGKKRVKHKLWNIFAARNIHPAVYQIELYTFIRWACRECAEYFHSAEFDC